MNCPICQGPINNECWVAIPPLPAVLTGKTDPAQPVTTHQVIGYCDYCDGIIDTIVRCNHVAGSMQVATVEFVLPGRRERFKKLLDKLPNAGRSIIMLDKVTRSSSGARTRRRGRRGTPSPIGA